MSAPEAELTFVDGRNALAYVMLLPGSKPGGITVDAGANGISKLGAAIALRMVADTWDPPKDDRRLVTVCDRCLQASCLAGEFMCQDAKGAGAVALPVMALQALDRENAKWWVER